MFLRENELIINVTCRHKFSVSVK